MCVCAALRLDLLVLLLLLNLEEQSAVDVGENTTVGNGGANKSVELFVATDGQLEMSGGDTLDLQVLGGVLQAKLAKKAQKRGKRGGYVRRQARGLRQSGTQGRR